MIVKKFVTATDIMESLPSRKLNPVFIEQLYRHLREVLISGTAEMKLTWDNVAKPAVMASSRVKCMVCGAIGPEAHDPKCFNHPLIMHATVFPRGCPDPFCKQCYGTVGPTLANPLGVSAPIAPPPALPPAPPKGNWRLIGGVWHCMPHGLSLCGVCQSRAASPPANLDPNPVVPAPVDLRSPEQFAAEKRAAGWKGASSLPHDADYD